MKRLHNKKFQWDRAGAQCFGPAFHLQPFTVQQSASLLAARLHEFMRYALWDNYGTNLNYIYFIRIFGYGRLLMLDRARAFIANLSGTNEV